MKTPGMHQSREFKLPSSKSHIVTLQLVAALLPSPLTLHVQLPGLVTTASTSVLSDCKQPEEGGRVLRRRECQAIERGEEETRECVVRGMERWMTGLEGGDAGCEC